jgi:hypothetical protein
MAGGDQRLAQKSIAIVLIVTLLSFVGVAPAIMLFATGVVVVVWFVSRRAQDRDLQRIFEFYVTADAILRDEERKWFGFELAEVIEEGERALDAIPDSPPLHFFTLGALYHRIGNYDASVDYLSRVLEDEVWSEQHRMAPSPQLRRYVKMVRQIEYEPSRAPAVLAAIRNLERARRKTAAHLLLQSRNLQTATISSDTQQSPIQTQVSDERAATAANPNDITPPPPITDVLHALYQDASSEQKPN